MTRHRTHAFFAFVACLALAVTASGQAVLDETQAGLETVTDDRIVLDRVFQPFAAANNAAALDAATLPPVEFEPPVMDGPLRPDALVDQTLGCLMGTQDGADINNGLIRVGVRCFGEENIFRSGATCPSFPYVGLRYIPTCARSTEPGCQCEGWGIAEATWNGSTVVCSGQSGQANRSVGGVQNLSLVSFASDATQAVSTVRMGSPPVFEVTHDFRPSSLTANIYEAVVNVRNITSTPRPAIYRRVMDWDIDPTPFSEYVTIVVSGSSLVNIVRTNTNGFNAGNPCSFSSYQVGPPQAGNIIDSGPADHGAMFDLDLGVLAPGQTSYFVMFWGAAANQNQAITAMNMVGATTYSLGQANVDPTNGTPNTFFIGFAASAGCGNGILETGEECDDGNTVAGDGCDPVCRRERLGPPTCTAAATRLTSNQVQLTGTASDPDGDPITVNWTSNCGATFVPSSNVLSPLANVPGSPCTCDFTLTVTSPDGTCTKTVTVNCLDSTPPTFTPPPNLSFDCVADVTACDPSVISDEADNCGGVVDVTCLADVDNGGTGCASSPLIIARGYRATDACGNTQVHTQTITVVDDEGPVVTASAAITCLWSPNHKFVDVGLTATAVDNCDPAPVLSVAGISSSEPTATQLGAGGPIHCPDAIVNGLSVQLRSERSGLEEGRVYGITVRATDECGNVSDTLVEVRVPHDQNPKSPGQTNGNDPLGPCEATGAGGSYDATACN